MKIVICEDEKIYSDKLLNLLETYFEKHNHMLDVSVFTDGMPLIQEYNNGSRFDLIFLDIQLEVSDGVNIASQLRALDSEVPLIFVTGSVVGSVGGSVTGAVVGA